MARFVETSTWCGFVRVALDEYNIERTAMCIDDYCSGRASNDVRRELEGKLADAPASHAIYCDYSERCRCGELILVNTDDEMLKRALRAAQDMQDLAARRELHASL